MQLYAKMGKFLLPEQSLIGPKTFQSNDPQIWIGLKNEKDMVGQTQDYHGSSGESLDEVEKLITKLLMNLKSGEEESDYLLRLSKSFWNKEKSLAERTFRKNLPSQHTEMGAMWWGW